MILFLCSIEEEWVAAADCTGKLARKRIREDKRRILFLYPPPPPCSVSGMSHESLCKGEGRPERSER